MFFQAKNWALTGWIHKKCRSLTEIFDEFEEKIQCVLGSHEVGTETKKEHIQAYVQFKKKIRKKQVLKIFPSGQWRVSIERTDAATNKKYCTKNGTQYIELGMLITKGQPKEMTTVSDKIEKGATYSELWRDHRPFMIRHYRGVQEAIAVRDRVDVAKRYDLDDFKLMQVPPIQSWGRAQIFHGRPGTGKTSYALALFKKPLLVSHIDTLKLLEPGRHDGVVFDDMCFSGNEDGKGAWPVGSCIHLVDVEYHREINVKHTTAYLPAGMRRVFCTNEVGGLIFPHQEDGVYGIQRRIEYTDFDLCLDFKGQVRSS